MGRVDFITSTFGKALGGAGGAFIATRKEAAEFLRQRSRSYLFSNTLDTAVTGASLFAIKHIQAHPEIREKLWSNTRAFRSAMKDAGFVIQNVEHPISPIMLADEALALSTAKAMLEEGIYVIGFTYPVVPKGKARIRVQISAAHTSDDINRAVEAFSRIAKIV
jgi:glycine C-acetyltransferase